MWVFNTHEKIPCIYIYIYILIVIWNRKFYIQMYHLLCDWGSILSRQRIWRETNNIFISICRQRQYSHPCSPTQTVYNRNWEISCFVFALANLHNTVYQNLQIRWNTIKGMQISFRSQCSRTTSVFFLLTIYLQGKVLHKMKWNEMIKFPWRERRNKTRTEIE